MTDNTIIAEPTKSLFIDMLTRDIALIPSIVDLVDNSTDGAKSIRGDERYDGLSVRVKVSSDEFHVKDNCGGIPIEVARNYAFRFGRSEEMRPVKHSVGEFGVGMKRAIFKIGRKFKVESATADSRFVVEENVDEWAKKPGWTFEFSEMEENLEIDEGDQGTGITVTCLREDVAESFKQDIFKNELRSELRTRLQYPLSKGLTVTLNGTPVTFEPAKLLAHERLAPAYLSLSYPESGPDPVTVKLYCGLHKGEKPASAGWYVYCNGRMILEADKTEVTGWGYKDDTASIPGFHNQFTMFRGYAYFDSDSTGKLPWNTTKTGLNTDSVIYRAAKLEMIRLMRPVVDFLNKLKEEKEERAKSQEGNEDESGPLQLLIDSAILSDVDSVDTRDTFSTPQVVPLTSEVGQRKQRIQYEVAMDRFNAVNAALNAKSIKEVGEKTFDYYYNSEISD